MSFRGEFNWIQCLHQGGRKAISFTLKCTNMFQTETFDAAIIDGNGQLQPMMFRQQRLAANKSLRFDFDTVGWDWCQGDTFAIIGATIADNFGVRMPEGTIGTSMLDQIK